MGQRTIDTTIEGFNINHANSRVRQFNFPSQEIILNTTMRGPHTKGLKRAVNFIGLPANEGIAAVIGMTAGSLAFGPAVQPDNHGNGITVPQYNTDFFNYVGSQMSIDNLASVAADSAKGFFKSVGNFLGSFFSTKEAYGQGNSLIINGQKRQPKAEHTYTIKGPNGQIPVLQLHEADGRTRFTSDEYRKSFFEQINRLNSDSSTRGKIDSILTELNKLQNNVYQIFLDYVSGGKKQYSSADSAEANLVAKGLQAPINDAIGRFISHITEVRGNHFSITPPPEQPQPKPQPKPVQSKYKQLEQKIERDTEGGMGGLTRFTHSFGHDKNGYYFKLENYFRADGTKEAFSGTIEDFAHNIYNAMRFKSLQTVKEDSPEYNLTVGTLRDALLELNSKIYSKNLEGKDAPWLKDGKIIPEKLSGGFNVYYKLHDPATANYGLQGTDLVSVLDTLASKNQVLQDMLGFFEMMGKDEEQRQHILQVESEKRDAFRAGERLKEERDQIQTEYKQFKELTQEQIRERDARLDSVDRESQLAQRLINEKDAKLREATDFYTEATDIMVTQLTALRDTLIEGRTKWLSDLRQLQQILKGDSLTIGQQQERISMLNDERDQYKTQAEQYQAEVSQQRSAIDELKRLRDQAASELENKGVALQNISSKLEDALRTNSLTAEQLGQLEQQKASLKNEYNSLSSEYQSSKNNFAAAELNYQNTIKQLQLQSTEEAQRFQARLNEFSMKSGEQSGRINELTDILTQKESAIISLTQERDQYKTALDTTKTALEQKELQINYLTGEVGSAKTRVRSMGSEIDNLQSLLKKKENMSDSLRTAMLGKIDSLTTNLGNLIADYDSLQGALNTTVTEYEGLLAQRDTTYTRKERKLLKRLQEAQNRARTDSLAIADNLVRLIELNYQIATRDTTITNLTEKLNSYETELENKRRAITELDSLKGLSALEVQAKGLEIDSLQKIIYSALESKGLTEEQLASIKSDLDTLKAQYGLLSTTHANLQAQYDTTILNYDRRLNELKQARTEEAQEFQEKLNRREQQSRADSIVIARRDEDIGRLNERITRKDQTIDDLTQERDLYKGNYDSTLTQLSSTSSELETKQKRLAELIGQVASLENKVYNLTGDNEAVGRANAALRTSLEQSSGTITDLDKQIEFLVKQRKLLEGEVAKYKSQRDAATAALNERYINFNVAMGGRLMYAGDFRLAGGSITLENLMNEWGIDAAVYIPFGSKEWREINKPKPANGNGKKFQEVYTDNKEKPNMGGSIAVTRNLGSKYRVRGGATIFSSSTDPYKTSTLHLESGATEEPDQLTLPADKLTHVILEVAGIYYLGVKRQWGIEITTGYDTNAKKLMFGFGVGARFQ